MERCKNDAPQRYRNAKWRRWAQCTYYGVDFPSFFLNHAFTHRWRRISALHCGHFDSYVNTRLLKLPENLSFSHGALGSISRRSWQSRLITAITYLNSKFCSCRTHALTHARTHTYICGCARLCSCFWCFKFNPASLRVLEVSHQNPSWGWPAILSFICKLGFAGKRQGSQPKHIESVEEQHVRNDSFYASLNAAGQQKFQMHSDAQNFSF